MHPWGADASGMQVLLFQCFSMLKKKAGASMDASFFTCRNMNLHPWRIWHWQSRAACLCFMISFSLILNSSKQIATHTTSIIHVSHGKAKHAKHTFV